MDLFHHQRQQQQQQQLQQQQQQRDITNGHWGNLQVKFEDFEDFENCFGQTFVAKGNTLFII